MKLDLLFKKLIESDCEAYKALRLRAFQESSSSFSESFEDELNQSNEFFRDCMGTGDEHFTMGCFATDNHLVGIATFKRDKRQKARHKSFIHTMYVLPPFRGRKIARTLLAELVKISRSMAGLEQIHLWVLNSKTSNARNLYLKAGFLAQGPCVKRDLIIDGEYVDAEYMTLEIHD